MKRISLPSAGFLRQAQDKRGKLGNLALTERSVADRLGAAKLR